VSARRDRDALSRRAFLACSGAVLGAGAIASVVGGGIADALGDASRSPRLRRRVAAQASDGWIEPPVRRSADGRLSTTLRAADTDTAIGNGSVHGVTYEDLYPGPTLHVHPGDTLRLDLINDTDQITNLHTHGLHISPNTPSDNVLLEVAAGDHFRYEYDIPSDHPGGTLWYHAHHHPLSDNQVFAGLFGALIVRGDIDELPGVAGVPERVLLISQIEIDDDTIVDADKSSLSKQVTLVNGQYQPTIEIAPGEIQRWRIMNASVVFFRLGLQGHEWHTIAVDGNTLTAPAVSGVVEVSPGARVDVLVRGGEAGEYALRSLSWERFGMFYTDGMLPVPQTITRMRSRGHASKVGELPATLLPFDDLRDATIDRRRVFELSEREPRGTSDLDKFTYYINGRKFDHEFVNETMLLGATEEWEFVNLTYEPHPMHIHVNPFQVVAVNGEPVDEQHYRDTVLVPPFGSVTIRTRFLDFTGQFVMHCHILFHEDHGMMQLLEVVDDETKAASAPSTAAAYAAGYRGSPNGATDDAYCNLPTY
jgi:FtsP/CotA-like multicopper oxidase with cupredoxin domain